MPCHARCRRPRNGKKTLLINASQCNSTPNRMVRGNAKAKKAHYTKEKKYRVITVVVIMK